MPKSEGRGYIHARVRRFPRSAQIAGRRFKRSVNECDGGCHDWLRAVHVCRSGNFEMAAGVNAPPTVRLESGDGEM
jgi:hypothetical protein